MNSLFLSYCLILVSVSLLLAGCLQKGVTVARSDPATLAEFEDDLGRLREELRIPGLSAAIAKDGRIVWTRGFGYADRGDSVAADTGSVYHLRRC